MLLLLLPVLLLALLAAFYLPIKRLYNAHNPARTPPVLPTTASTTALHPTPPPPSSLRGRGRGRARSKGRLFGFGIGDRLGLGLGRRAKSLGGPLLPRFASNANEHGHAAYTPLASAPASPSLSASASLHPPSPYLAEFPADPTAVPLVDLGASWGTLSSISHASSSSSHAHTHAQLVDVSHAGDAEYALVDVSVPPSPAAWARAHPPLKPTPTSSFPTSPAAPTFPASLSFSKSAGDADALTHLPSPPLSPTFPASSPATARPGSALVGFAFTSTTLASSPSLASSKAESESRVSKDVPEEPFAPSPKQESPPPPPAVVSAPPLLLPVATATSAAWDRADEEDELDEFRHAVEAAREPEPLLHASPSSPSSPLMNTTNTMTATTKAALHIDLPAPHVFASAEQEVGEEFGAEVGEGVGEQEEGEEELPSAHAIDALLAGVRALHPPASASPAGRSPVAVVEVNEVAEQGVERVGRVEAGRDVELEEIEVLLDDEEAEEEATPAPAPPAPAPAAPAPRLLFPRPRANSHAHSSSSSSSSQSDFHEDDEPSWAHDTELGPLPASLLHARGYGESKDEDGEAHAALVAWVDGLKPALAGRAPMDVVGAIEAAEVVEQAEDDAEGAVEGEGEEVGFKAEEVDEQVEVDDGAEAEEADAEDGALPVSPAPTRRTPAMDADEQAEVDADVEQADADVEQAEVEVEGLPVSPAPTRGAAVMDADDEQADDPADLPLPSTTPVRARFDFGSADVAVGDEDQDGDPEELALPAMPLPAPPLLAVRAPILPLDVDEDIEEQDLASPASSSPSSSPARLPSARLPPSSPSSSSSSDLEDEEDIASPRALALVLRPRATPAWSRRAAAAPALGLPSSTLHLNSAVRENLNGALRESLNSAVSSAVKEREWDLREWEAGWVPGAFPSSSAASIAAQDKDAQAKDNAHSATTDGTSQAVTKTKPELRPRRSPLDAALAMQLRPGLGLGADGAWLVRFLMSFFGWLGVLVAGNANANGGAGGRRRV
ncbi:hypothetical protein C8R46DRAFT_1192863 [Mycena filopes]|nr:hypothetical protein C8R46DRAFT_1192863 [Mycena filopes]